MPSPLLEKLFSVAETHPEREAIVERSGAITYSSLAQEVREVGTRLAANTVVEARVILVLENSIEFVVSMYACWYAGLVVVPIDVSARRRELSRVINTTKPSFLISSGQNRFATEVAQEVGLPVVRVPSRSQRNSEHSDASRRNCDDAIVVFTSGTTGNPKGVVLTQKNLASNANSIIQYLGLSASDSSVVVLPFNYSYGNSILHSHLCVGAKLLIGDSMMYPQRVADRLRQSGVTGFSGVPTTFSLLLSRSDFAVDPPPLRYVTQAGGPMGKALTSSLVGALNPKTDLYVMYGQTEATARLTWLPPNCLSEKLGSVGIPIPGVQIKVCDESGQRVGVGQIGEVVASGDNIMSRYWNNPVETEKVLAEGWLRTGDLGYLDSDGYLFLVDRASEMIKSGAFRVSPSEIEELIGELEFVDQVAVCGVPDDLLGQVPIAFVVGEESSCNTQEITRYCRKNLSLQKVPREIYWRKALPRTSSGKLRRRVLSESYLKGNWK